MFLLNYIIILYNIHDFFISNPTNHSVKTMYLVVSLLSYVVTKLAWSWSVF